MPMNEIIQQRRRALGLTQEQVAEALSVSVPAVSKWERGTSCPDIALLPPLARLLKIDLNELFCFREEITPQEIGEFCRQVAEAVRVEGVGAAFALARQKLREYPQNDSLLHCLALQLDGLLLTAGMPEAQAGPFREQLQTWYDRLMESEQEAIRNNVLFLQAGRAIGRGEYDLAEVLLQRMPEKEDALQQLADKRMLQITLYQRQGKREKAEECLQRELLLAANKVQLLLQKMTEGRLEAGDSDGAKYAAAVSGRFAALLEQPCQNEHIASLQVAMSERNVADSLALLRQLAEAMKQPWEAERTHLFSCITSTLDIRQMLPAIMREMESDPAYDFLRDREEFIDLLEEYRRLNEESGVQSHQASAISSICRASE